MKLNTTLLEARVYHALKSLPIKGETIEPRTLEIAICESFGMKHVGDSAYYADGVKNNIQASVKTRMINPHILKTKEGRDFQSNPTRFLGPQQNKKQDKWIYGMEIVQRRQQLNLKNDSAADPNDVGKLTIQGFLENVQESAKKYNTDTTYEIIGIHGYDKTNSNYLISLFWKEYEALDPEKITWIREGYGVSGYIRVNGIDKRICERVNGNAKREATCFKEYKNLLEYKDTVHLSIPIPDLWPFDLALIESEIRSKKLQLAA